MAFIAAITLVLAMIGRSTIRQTATHLLDATDADTEQVSLAAPDSEAHACACFHGPVNTTTAATPQQSPGASPVQSESNSSSSSDTANRNLCALWMSAQPPGSTLADSNSAASPNGPGCTDCLGCCQRMAAQTARR